MKRKSKRNPEERDTVLLGSVTGNLFGSEAALREIHELVRKQQEEAVLRDIHELVRKQREEAALRESREALRKQQREEIARQEVPKLQLTKSQLRSVQKLVRQQQAGLVKK